MGVTARKVLKDDPLGTKVLVIPIITAVSQSDVIAYAHQPGHPFEIVSVEGYCRTEAGAVSADVKIGTVTALNAVHAFVTATRALAVLATALASRRGSATDVINVHYTSDGTGALTNGFITVRYRPVPMNGDVQTE